MTTVRLFRHHIRITYLVLALADCLVFAISVYVAEQIRFEDSSVLFTSVGWLRSPAIAVATVMVGVLLGMGLYQARPIGSRWMLLGQLGAAFLLGIVILSLLFYFVPHLYVGRGVLILSMLIAFVVIYVSRLVFYRLLSTDLLKHRLLVLGSGLRAQPVDVLRQTADTRGYTIVGFVHVEGEQDVVEPECVITLNPSLSNFVFSNRIDEVVVAVTDRRKDFPLHELMECKMRGVATIDVADFIEREVKKIRLEGLHPGDFIFSDGFRRNPIREIVKRSFDILASFFILLMTWPIMCLVPLAIKIEDGWRAPVFFRQVRVGEDDRPFMLLKFRSMGENAETDGHAQWAEKDDPRVTRVGAIIRRYRIDELPQILNVLRGEMSLIGPRPERPEFVRELATTIPYYRERHRVRPGITGWAQLHYQYGANEDDAREKLQYDLYYVKNHSLMLDVLIMLQTLGVVISGKGAR